MARSDSQTGGLVSFEIDPDQHDRALAVVASLRESPTDREVVGELIDLVLDLTDTSRNGEERTEVRWTAALNPPPYLKPFRKIVESQLAAVWAPSLETLLDAVIARRT